MSSVSPPVESFKLKREFNLYFAFIRNAFLNMLAYRLRYYTGILTYLLLVSVQYFIWTGIYASKADGATLYGYKLGEMITYVAVGWISRSFYHSNIDYEIDDLVKTGEIGIYLLRPVNFQIMMTAKALGESLFRIGLFSLPICITMLIFFPVLPPSSSGYFLYFCLSTCLGFLVLAQFNFLIGLWAFSLKTIQGVMRAKYYLVQLCSGLLLPLAFFPDWARSILEALPFQAVAYVPLQFYLGKVPAEDVLSTFGLQIGWLLALGLVGQLLWQRALARLSVQGG